MTGSDRSEIIEMFDDLGIQHGERFDDGRRWCGVCENPRLACITEAVSSWKDKVCGECHAVWPEHIEEFMAGIIEDNDELDKFTEYTIN